jgi:hypothetical protein
MGDDVKIPIEQGGAGWRLWVGTIWLAVSTWMIVAGFHDKRGDVGMMGAFVHLVLSPLSGSLLLSGIAIKRKWRPKLLFRLLPLVVFAVCGLLAIVLAMAGVRL